MLSPMNAPNAPAAMMTQALIAVAGGHTAGDDCGLTGDDGEDGIEQRNRQHQEREPGRAGERFDPSDHLFEQAAASTVGRRYLTAGLGNERGYTDPGTIAGSMRIDGGG